MDVKEIVLSGQKEKTAMTLNHYQLLAMKTDCQHTSDKEGLVNAVFGLSGEVGEFADILKKHYFQGGPFDRNHLVKELGDIQWYVAQAATYLGVSLGEVAEINIEKLEKRYPEGFSSEKSNHRQEGDI